jgi:PAS domain S-box-containing protein
MKDVKNKLFSTEELKQTRDAMDFMANLLQSSTEYSIIGKDLDGKILLWNEGARRIYGYDSEEVVGKANSSILHTEDDVNAGKPRQMTEAALRDGKWEGTINRRRKNGDIFTARIVITPRRDESGKPIGFLLISKDVSNEIRFTDQLRKAKLFDSAIVSNAQEAVDFITNILESSTEYSVIGKDLDGKILLWNEGARRLYGYEPEEVVGKANSSILHTEEDVKAGKPREILGAALHNGKWEGTINRRRKNGEMFTARVVITPRRDSLGRAIGFLLISKDISDEIRLTEQLKSTQFYTRSLIESNIDALMTTDPLGIISDVNKQMVTLTGYTRDELIGSPFKNYFTDPERAEEGIKLVLREGKVTNYELTALSKTGKRTVVSYNASTFRDAEGKLQGVFAAARDITEQKELEQRLRESESYNRGLIEASVDGLITVDPAGLISDVNARMCQMSGYAREELIGTPFIDYFVDTDRADAGVKQTFDKGVVTDYALTLATRDGRQLVVSFNASVFKDPSGAMRGIFASARDITDQARLQTQLSEERAYNRGLIEASLDGLITVDPMLNITDVNETMCRMAGYARRELIGTPFPDYFTDSKRAAEGVRLTLDKGAVTNYELTLHSKDGAEQLVSFNAAIFKDEAGAVRGIFASARNITEQAKLQTQLAEERAYNRGLIEASVDGLVTVDESMLITDVNETMCRMAGRTRNQLIGSSFPNYFTERDRAAEGVHLTFKEGSVTNYVLTLQAMNGQKVPVSFNAAVFKDASGKVRGIFASARDITEQKKLESQLQASQFYTRSLIESNIDALMTTDPVGIITDVNQQMEALTGFNREELIGSPFKNYFTDPRTAEEGIRLVLREGNVTNYELTARGKQGGETVVSYNATTFADRDGKLQGVFAAARDVTERKRFEQTLQEKSAEMENANLSKDRFLASMSHELRTPLNAVIGFTGTLLMKLPGPLTRDQESQLQNISTSAKHLLLLINDLLDLAKIESGKVELKPEPTSCQSVVQEVLATLRPMAEAKGLKLTGTMPDRELVLNTDRRSLSQVLLNLTYNAIKFTEKGEVRVELRHNHLDGLVRVEFRVTDTGIGIKPEDQDKLFHAFTQVDSSSSRRYEGTGLGLHLSQRLAELLKGRITFKSEYGKGSEFTMTLETQR